MNSQEPLFARPISKTIYEDSSSWKLNNSPKGTLRLTDEQVVWARSAIKEMTYKEIASVLKVRLNTARLAIQGVTYKHLNRVAVPQLG